MDYLIWANIYLAVFYGFYWFFLRKETFFQLNRSYLLCSILVSFILPLVDLKAYFFPIKTGELFYTLSLEAQVNQVVNSSVSAWSALPDISILVLIYITGCIFSLVKLLYRFAVIKRNFNTFYPGQAYSFFHNVHIDPELSGYSTIVAHEDIHIRQFHSLDIVLVELVKIANWFNPLVYLLHRSVKLNHEYIADSIVTQSDNDRTGYAQTLLSQAFDTPIHSLTNNFFNQSIIKKRIAMLFKNKSKKLVLSRFFLLIPVLIVMLAFQAKEPSLSKSPAIDFTNSAPFNQSTTALDVLQPDTNTIFVAVEVPPVPPGGMAEFLKYVGTNYVYPKEAEDANVKGRIIMTFVVEKDGSLSDIKCVRDLGFGTGEEAIRVLKNSPKWKPGMQNGHVVRVEYTLPIVFNLSSGDLQE